MPKMEASEIKFKYLPDWHFVGCFKAEHNGEGLYADIYAKLVEGDELYAVVLNGYAAKKVDPMLQDNKGDGFFWIVFTDGVQASGISCEHTTVRPINCINYIRYGNALTWATYVKGNRHYRTFAYEIYKEAFGEPKGMEGQAETQEIAQAEPEGQKKCTCPIDQLMYSGCGCGGA